MEFKDVQKRALEIREHYHKLEEEKLGRPWTREEVMQGFVGDVGDLMRFTMAKAGIREIDDIVSKIAHELSDCLWSIMVLAKKYDVDLEKEFLTTMDELEDRVVKNKRL